MSFRFAPYTESHARDGRHRIERSDFDTWRMFLDWRHVATFAKRSDAREFIRDAKKLPRFS